MFHRIINFKGLEFKKNKVEDPELLSNKSSESSKITELCLFQFFDLAEVVQCA